MKKAFLMVGILVTLILFLSGCTEDKSSVDPLENLEYKNTEYGFGINPPEGWNISENDNYGAVRFTGPVVDNFAVNFGITQPFSLGSETLESISKEMISNYKQEDTGFEKFVEISNNSITVNSMDGHDIVYSYMLQGNKIYGKQVLVEKDNKVVVLTYAAVQSSYDKYVDDFDQSVNTFTMF